MKLTFELDDATLDDLARRIAARLTPDRSGVADALIGHRDAGVSARTWSRAVREGKLAAVRVGRDLKARRSAVDAWLAGLAAPTRPAPVASTATAGDDVDAELTELLRMGKLRVVK